MNRFKTALLVLILAAIAAPASAAILPPSPTAPERKTTAIARSQDSADCLIRNGRIVDGNRGGVRVFRIRTQRYTYVRQPARRR